MFMVELTKWISSPKCGSTPVKTNDTIYKNENLNLSASLHFVTLIREISIEYFT